MCCYYYGDHVPNFSQLKPSDPAHIQPGYDYDVITAEALIERASVRDGKYCLPDGMNYRVLVLPDRDADFTAGAGKNPELVTAGATVIGPKPTRAETLEDFAATDAEGAKNGGRIVGRKTWQPAALSPAKPRAKFCRPTAFSRTANFSMRPAADLITSIAPRATRKFILSPTAPPTPSAVNCAFRVTARRRNYGIPSPANGNSPQAYEEKDGRTVVPLDFGPAARGLLCSANQRSAHPAVAKLNTR